MKHLILLLLFTLFICLPHAGYCLESGAQCYDNLNNDGDAAADCGDPDCSTHPVCTSTDIRQLRMFDGANTIKIAVQPLSTGNAGGDSKLRIKDGGQSWGILTMSGTVPAPYGTGFKIYLDNSGTSYQLIRYVPTCSVAADCGAIYWWPGTATCSGPLVIQNSSSWTCSGGRCLISSTITSLTRETCSGSCLNGACVP